MERFLDPAVWMEKRLAYTRSVATSSIGTDSAVCSLIFVILMQHVTNNIKSQVCLISVIQRILFCTTVGYIVGLGDRHIQNILIDEQTAELVHIDLGKITSSQKVASV